MGLVRRLLWVINSWRFTLYLKKFWRIRKCEQRVQRTEQIRDDGYPLCSFKFQVTLTNIVQLVQHGISSGRIYSASAYSSNLVSGQQVNTRVNLVQKHFLIRMMFSASAGEHVIQFRPIPIYTSTFKLRLAAKIKHKLGLLRLRH